MTEEQKQAQRQVIAALYFVCGTLEEEASISPVKIGTMLAIISGGIEGATEKLEKLI